MTRVAAAYAVIAWLLLQAADILFGNFEAPGWVFRSFATFLILGFPLAVFLAWAYDLTPEGVKRTEVVPAAESGAPRIGRRLEWVIGLGALSVIALLLFGRPWPGSQQETAEAVPDADPASKVSAARSIAVLAFDDLSPEGNQAYFAEGVSEELLNLLARIEGLKVAARTSSFKFKDGAADIGEIGRALNVETVLEGSVRKAGGQVRVTAQLIDVGSGFHLWSASFDRQLENIFAVQDEIAAAIVAALKLKLDIGAATAARTVNTEAYDHYLRGRQFAREPTRAGLLRGIDLFEKAIALDPGFAAPFGGIAEAWVWLEDYGGVKSSEAFPKAERAARRALELDPHSAEAHAAMAFVRDRYYSDSRGAREYFERALAINPSYVSAYNLYGDTLRDLGELERMIAVHRKAVELDPLSVFMKTRLAAKLTDFGGSRQAEAARLIGAVLEEFPGNDYGQEELGNLYRQQGRLADAFTAYRLVHFARPGDPYSAAQLGQLALFMGDEPLATAWIAAAREQGEDNRWELHPRQKLAESRGEWGDLDRVGQLRGGPEGALMRGVAAARRQAFPEAHGHLLQALKLKGYQPEHGAVLKQLGILIELAWVEQQSGLPDWADRAGAARGMLEGLRAAEVLNLFGIGMRIDYGRARVAAIEKDRAAALDHLRAVVKQGFSEHWFLDRDPVFAAWRDDPEFRAIVDGMLAHAASERARLEGSEDRP